MKSFIVSYEAATLLKTPATVNLSMVTLLRLKGGQYLELPFLIPAQFQIRSGLFFHGSRIVRGILLGVWSWRAIAVIVLVNNGIWKLAVRV
jgi:hypothetical protein